MLLIFWVTTRKKYTVCIILQYAIFFWIEKNLHTFTKLHTVEFVLHINLFGATASRSYEYAACNLLLHWISVWIEKKLNTAELMLHINSLDAADILAYNTQKISMHSILAHTIHTSALSAYWHIISIQTHTQHTGK